MWHCRRVNQGRAKGRVGTSAEGGKGEGRDGGEGTASVVRDVVAREGNQTEMTGVESDCESWRKAAGC